MGDMADDMVNGVTCSICGSMFRGKTIHDEIPEHGYPVACWHCWNKNTKECKSMGLQKALYKTL